MRNSFESRITNYESRTVDPVKSSTYICDACGGASSKWSGQCPDCGAWNTLTESRIEPARGRRTGAKAQVRATESLGAIAVRATPRRSSGVAELDRVLGGGLVTGSVVLIGGDPGIGKSTLLLQSMAALEQGALYVTGEESLEQVALRARRLGLSAPALRLLADNHLETILATVERSPPEVLVLDSIQTLYTDALQSAPGSVAQVRETAAGLVRLAKTRGVTVILVGHVTKEGALAGPRVLEHMVDTVLYFEGDRQTSFRLLRAVKNRFGPVNEIGVFAMTEKGLKEVGNPSALFVTRDHAASPGSVIFGAQEGTRPMLVEVQALVDRSALASPRRLTVGLDQNRLSMLLAVLNRHAGMSFHDHDVFVNVVGGVRVTEPAADLAVLLAVASSLRNRPLPEDLVVFGEAGLAGEVRPVQRGVERAREAVKLGYGRVLLPEANRSRAFPRDINAIGVSRVSDALAKAFDRA
jgi:DNA repair protein RadA/Sms